MGDSSQRSLALCVCLSVCVLYTYYVAAYSSPGSSPPNTQWGWPPLVALPPAGSEESLTARGKVWAGDGERGGREK